MITSYLEDLKSEILKEMEDRLSPVKRYGKEYCDKISEYLDNIKKISYELTYIEKTQGALSDTEFKKYQTAIRSAERFSKKLIEEASCITTPSEVTYSNLSQLFEDVKKFLFLINDIGKRWVPKMAPWFKSELKELDFYIRKLSKVFQDMQEFLNQHESLKKLESVLSNVDRLKKLTEEITELKKQLAEENQNKINLEKQLETFKSKLEKIYSKGLKKDILDAEETEESIKARVNSVFNPLKKILEKYMRLLTEGKAFLKPELKAYIESYISDPYAALLNETQGYPKLKQILKHLKKTLENREIKIKQSRINKALRLVKEICEQDSLLPLQNKGKSIKETKIELTKEIKTSGIEATEEELCEKIQTIEDEISDINSNISRIQDDLNKTIEKVKKEANIIKEDLANLTENRVKFNLEILETLQNNSTDTLTDQ
ncbi:MAG: hypothetical protein ACTSSJ_03050 [Candidatus Odinarchaeia archaeon]